MSYLKDFLTQIHNRDFHKFLILWEEYSSSDEVETEEFSQLLKALKTSDMAKSFGQIVETALPLWKTIQDKNASYEILSLLIDLQTTNSPLLIQLIMDTLEGYHGQDPKFQEKIKLAGLRNGDNYQGAIAKYDLIHHLGKGKMVFHTGGWGTGEIMDISFIRENLTIEFENVAGRKDLSFSNAFKTLIPLSDNHFLAKRFANPDQLEKEGREDSAALIKQFLHDMGPKSAYEIKEELCELVIPEKDWTKWWQGTRAKLKKDPIVETPESLKGVFYLRKAEVSHDDQLKKLMKEQSPLKFIQDTYSHLRDNSGALKQSVYKVALEQRLQELAGDDQLPKEQTLQIYFLLEQFFNDKNAEEKIGKLIAESHKIEQLIDKIDILAFKKRVLIATRENKKEWAEIFLRLLDLLSQSQLRDFLLLKLNTLENQHMLKAHLQKLLEHPQKSPDLFVWYFQKLINNEKDIPYQSKEGKWIWFEAFFILIHAIEGKPEYRDLLKKMYNLLSAKRYALVRELLQQTSIDYVKEFLLLVSKCQTFSDHDLQILRSLSEVVHPGLANSKNNKGENEEDQRIWTTEEGFLKIQDRIRQIGTVDVIENAREIEAARALGDLRENSEFKFAQERRARLQSELKTLSDQLKMARLIYPEDISIGEVGIGSVVEAVNPAGKKSVFTILGPWDADSDKNILSYNSKLAKAMNGKKVGETIDFKDDVFEIIGIKSYLDTI